MKIHPYLEKTTYALLSVGFGSLTLDHVIKAASLGQRVWDCYQYAGSSCQTPLFELGKLSATIVSTAYISFKFGAVALENQASGGTLSRVIPRFLRPDEAKVINTSPRPELIGPPKGASQ